MMQINNVPLSVFNRALELFGVEPEETIPAAKAALISAESRISMAIDDLTPFARAIAEFISSDVGYELR